MSALSNGTYFISSTIGGSDNFYLAFKNGLRGEGLVIDTLIGSESQQWEVEAYSVPNVYAFKNRRYQTYIDVSPPDVELAPVVAAADPRRWYLTPTDSGYVVGIDASATLTWNVRGGIAAADGIVQLYHFQNDGSMNEFWKFRPIQETPSTTASSSTSEAAMTASVPSTAQLSDSTSSTSTPAPSSTENEGLDQGTKVGLGTGLGLGIPATLAAILALWIRNH